METIRIGQIKRNEENNIKDWFSENDTKPTVALLLFLGFVFTESVFENLKSWYVLRNYGLCIEN